LDDPLRTVAERVLRAPGGMEIRFSQDRILTPIVTSAPPLGPCLDLTPSDTVLLTGGARGITAGISKEIARRHHCRIALIGRTPLPQDLPEHLHDLHPRMSQEELRAKIRERLKERGASVRPTDVAREIERMRASHEAAENIGAISEAGAEVVYFPCDITDRNALARTIEEIDARFGRITGIVHGAGIKWDAPLEKLTPRHWEAVFAPKVGAVESLSALIDPDSLRFFVVLSSIAALYGNATQGNYAAANRAVVALMRNLHEAHGVLAKAIYCPPISGVGMAADPGILRHLAQLGIDYGTPEALAAFVAEEIAVADPEVAVAWHGRVGALARYFAQAPSGGDPGRSGGGNGTRQPTPLSPAEGSDSFFDRVLEHQPNERIVLEKTFDVERDITLLDHAIEGTPVVPAIRGIEVFLAAASRLFPGKRIESLKDLRFLKWLKLEGGKPLTVRVKAEGTPEACKVYIEQEIRSPRGAQPGSYRIHFSGTVVFADQTSAASGLFSLEGLEEAGVSPKEIYRPDRFFHGPEFQVLGGVSRWGIEGAEGEYAPPKTIPGGNHLPRGIHPEHFLVLEALEQLAGIFDMRFHGTFALPAAFSQLRFIAAPVGPIRLRVMEVGGGAKERRFDLLALDRANRPVVSARGFTLKVIRTLVPSARFPEDTPPVPPVPGSSSMINSPLPGDGGNTQMAIAEVPLDRLEAAIRENPALIEAFLGEEEMEALLAMRHRRRRLERIGGTIAAKKAFLRYCARIEGRTPALTSLTLRHRKSGKPYLCVDGDPYPVALSIAHSG
ncbi:MAG: SDR family NAD(P)-dependent oxidoreductase, partial [Deltaproteobacteria bacterium]